LPSRIGQRRQERFCILVAFQRCIDNDRQGDRQRRPCRKVRFIVRAEPLGASLSRSTASRAFEQSRAAAMGAYGCSLTASAQQRRWWRESGARPQASHTRPLRCSVLPPPVPNAPVSIGTLYILDDGSDVAIVRAARRIARSLDSRSVLRRRQLPPLRPGPAPMASAGGNHGSLGNPHAPQLTPVSVPGLFFATIAGGSALSA
jgi:hypothetical protein